VRWGIAQRTAAGSTVLALVVAAGFGGLIVAIAQLQHTSDRAEHAATEIVTADALERLVTDLETGERGFVITGEDRFLEPVLRARTRIPALERRLNELVARDAEPAERARVAALMRAIDAYDRDHVTRVVAAARTDPARARRLVASGSGKRLTDAIRAGFAELTGAQEGLLVERRRSAAAAARRAYWLAGVAAGIALLLVLAFAWLLRRLVVRPVRELARGARRFGSGELSARVEVDAEGEVAELGAAFNEMAASLEGALRELLVEQERIERLFRFTERISAETDVEELAIAALDELAELTGASVGALYVSDGDELWLAAHHGIGEHELRPFARADRVTLGRPGELVLPLRHGERLVGIALLARATGGQLDPESADAAERLAGSVAIALANDLAYREARRIADVNQIVLDSTRDGIVMLDRDGQRVLVNAAYERLMDELGVPPHESFAERLAAFAQVTTEPEAFEASMRALIADAEVEAVSEFAAAASGRSFQLFSSPAREDGAYVGRVYVLHEVTREREADRLKSELLATVSHELRTPLAGILGFAELLQRRELDPDTRSAYLETVHQEAQRLTRLINDFLDLQRIEEGALSLVFEPLDVRDVVAEQIENHQRWSAAHTLELSAPDEPTEVLGDQARIAQVAGNLLSNAIKYSPAGGSVQVILEADGDAVRASVRDEGIGIAEADQPRIFEKFFRVDSSDTREIGGTGLGLALSREIVEAHGGRMGFKSRLGAGSTFWFELPSLAALGDGRRRVVLVEPDESGLTGLLEESGLRVDAAASGAEALRRLAGDPPALVCVDVALPGPLDGWELLAHLMTRPEAASTPILAVTAPSGTRLASALGAAGVVAKPVERAQLLAVVRRLLAP
jgi:signal transduction histidine kinase/CHASE3 domain sensor protein/CheY-like chemotaxis protein